MRQNGHGVVTIEDARVWMEETGFCLFLPRKQFAASVAPSFVEAVAGQRSQTPDQKQIALAEDLLIRLELDGVAVRLNLQGQLGEQPDYVVASWVLPYVYALRGDRDWRRTPQLTGSRQVSPLAVQTYKLLEAGETTVAKLAHALGREITESAVVRAITELWQQLRIIPVIAAAGQPASWQLLRVRFQKAIAEGASTSQVTAISVLASIYLQAVIAATMEEVEVFLAPLTARSKVREVLRGLMATRQVHTLALGHSPHYYVAGTLPEFSEPVSVYSSSIQATSIFGGFDSEESHPPAPVIQQPVRNESVFLSPMPATPLSAPVSPAVVAEPTPKAPVATPVVEPPAAAVSAPEAAAKEEPKPAESYSSRVVAPRKPAPPAKNAARPHFSRPTSSARNRKPSAGSSASAGRPSHRPGVGASKPVAGRHGASVAGGSHSTARPPAGKPAAHKSESASSWARPNGSKPKAKGAAPSHRPGSSAFKPAAGRKSSLVSSTAKAGARKSFAAGARSKQGAKKRS